MSSRRSPRRLTLHAVVTFAPGVVRIAVPDLIPVIALFFRFGLRQKGLS